MLWKQKLLIAVVWVVFSAATFLIVLRLPTVYKSETTILVEAQKIPDSLVKTTVQSELQDRLATIQQQILSTTQLLKVVEKHQLYKDRKNDTQEDIIERMRSDIRVDLEKGWARNRPGAIRVSFKSRDPQVTATVANELGVLFIEQNMREREGQAAGTEEFLKAQLEDARKKLQQQEQRMSEYKLKNSGTLPGQENAIMMSLSRLQGDLKSANEALNRAIQGKEIAEGDLRSQEGQLQRLKNAVQAELMAGGPGSQNAAPTTPAAGGTDDPTAKPKRSDVLQGQLDALMQRYSEQHPTVRYLRGEIERVKQLEAREARELKERVDKIKQQQAAAAAAGAKATEAPKIAGRVSPQVLAMQEQVLERIERLKSQISVFDQDIKNREKERAGLTAELAGYEGRMASLPAREQEMVSVTRDYDISKRQYDDLLNRVNTAEIGRDMESLQKAERFAILDPAHVPERPSEPNRPALNAAGVMAGIAIGLVLGLLAELKKNVILGEWELPEGVWLLGRIPVVTLEPEETSSGGKSRKKKEPAEVASGSASSGGLKSVEAEG